MCATLCKPVPQLIWWSAKRRSVIRMPKKGNSGTRILITVVALIAVASFVVVAWHDGLIGVTPIGNINSLSVSTGAVAVKGEITSIVGTTITLSDGTGGVSFEWVGPVTLHSIVVVRGVIWSAHILYLVSSVDVVWLFG
jgi:hypothetical protein